MKITSEIIEAISDKYELYIDWCEDYGEPGYSLGGKKGVLLGSWHDMPQRIYDRIERDFECEWYDEWIIDHNRSRAYRTSPDSYCWTSSVMFLDGEIFTIDDAEEDPEEYIELLINDYERANSFGVDLSKYGFTRIEGDLESGWYGREDSPHDILQALMDKYPEGEFVFSELSSEQFRINFSVWGRNIDA